MNKRRAIRFKKRLKVKFGPTEIANVGFLVDISSTGLCIKTSSVYRPGTTLRMNLFDNDSDDIISTEGYVAWAKKVPPSMMHRVKCGMGVQFLDICPALEQFFQNIRTV